MAKLRDEQTLWLAFRGVLQVFSCWLLTMDKGTQIWLPGPEWSSAQREGGGEQHCVSITKYCTGITSSCFLSQARLV